MRFAILVSTLLALSGCERLRGAKMFALCTPPSTAALADLTGDNAQSRYPHLSDLCLVDTEADGTLVFHPKSVSYELTAPLFSDYALKDRVVYLQPGAQATYSDSDVFDLPVGTIIAKSFSFTADLRDATLQRQVKETRVLIRANAGWLALPYQWDAARKDAPLSPGGAVLPMHFIAPNGDALDANYLVPSTAECQLCHNSDNIQHPIGLKARLLNRDHTYADGTVENQLDHWSRSGLLAGAPASAAAPRLPIWDDPNSGTVEARARGWLESNCAHCHSPGGLARTTGLFLGIDQTNPYAWGVCKTPVAAGTGSGNLYWDIDPGAATQSIVSYRIGSTAPGTMMPEVGRSVVHKEGLALVNDFINQLTLTPCK